MVHRPPWADRCCSRRTLSRGAVPGQEAPCGARPASVPRSRYASLPVGRPRAGQADAQFGHAEHAGQEWADDVDGLDAGEGEALRVLADEPGLNAQGVVFEAPPRHHPVDVAVDHRDGGERDEVVGLGRSILRGGVDVRRPGARRGRAPGGRAGPPGTPDGVAASLRWPGGLLTCPLPWPHRARSGGRAGGSPLPPRARECGRRWPPPPCAA